MLNSEFVHHRCERPNYFSGIFAHYGVCCCLARSGSSGMAAFWGSKGVARFWLRTVGEAAALGQSRNHIAM